MENLEKYLIQKDRQEGIKYLVGEKKLEAQIQQQLQNYVCQDFSSKSQLEEMLKQYQGQYGKNQTFQQLYFKLLIKVLENEQDQQILKETIEKLENIYQVTYPSQIYQQTSQQETEKDFAINEIVLGLERFLDLVEKEKENLDRFNMFYLMKLDPLVLQKQSYLEWFKKRGYLIIPFLGNNFNIFQLLLSENNQITLTQELEDTQFQQICQMHTFQQLERAFLKYPDLYNHIQIVLILLSKRFNKHKIEDKEMMLNITSIIEWIEQSIPEKFQIIKANLKFYFTIFLYSLKIKLKVYIGYNEIIKIMQMKQLCFQERNASFFQAIMNNKFLGLKVNEEETISIILSELFKNEQCKDIGELSYFLEESTLQKQFDLEKVKIGQRQKYNTLDAKMIEQIQKEEQLQFEHE